MSAEIFLQREREGVAVLQTGLQIGLQTGLQTGLPIGLHTGLQTGLQRGLTSSTVARAAASNNIKHVIAGALPPPYFLGNDTVGLGREKKSASIRIIEVATTDRCQRRTSEGT